MHVGKIEFLFALGFVYLVVFAAVVSVPTVLLAPFHILGRCHHDGGREICGTNLGANDIAVDRVVVGHLIPQARGALQVHGTLVQVVVGDGCDTLYFPTWVE